MLLLTLVFCLLGCSYGESYQNMKVLSINFENDHQKEHFLKLSEVLNIDIWRINSTNSEFMINNNLASYFQDFQPTVLIDNVQDLIDSTEISNGLTGIFDSFPSYDDVNSWLDEQVAAYPTFTTKIEVGQTYLGNKINGLKIARDPTKPNFIIQCTIHAREWITTTTCLWIIDQLLNLDPERGTLLAKYQWYIVPVLNVDGYEYSRTSTRLWRKNRQPNSGSSCVGTDLNRNYKYQWGGAGSSSDPCSETFRGSSAYSSTEISAEINYFKSLFSTTAAFVDIHSYGGYFMSPWGYTTTRPPAYTQMSAAMQTVTDAIYAVNRETYQYGSSAAVLYASAGGSDDDTYGSYGIIYSFTVEVSGTSFN